MEKQLSFQEVRKLEQKVKQTVRFGNVDKIKTLLSNVSSEVVKEILDDQACEDNSKKTPLTIAVTCGRLTVVKLLINHFIAGLDNTGTNEFLSRSCQTALNLAAQRGRLNIVKWLVNRGCDVNQDSKGRGTPLFLACGANRLNVVKYLVENGADIEATGEYGYTCLMAACLSGGKGLVRYLLKKGADINGKSRDGSTPSHVAACNDTPQIVELLLQHGATMSKNDDGLSPSIEAAWMRKSDVVDVFVESSAVSRKEKIDMLELLGARMAGKDIHETFRYLHQAMVERHKDPSEVISKPHSPLLTRSDIAESQTPEELESRQFDQDILHLESLAILQRIFGSDSTRYSDQLFIRFQTLIREGRFTDAITLTSHWAKDGSRYAEMRTIFSSQFDDIINRFAEMLATGQSPGVSSVVNCLELTFLMMQLEEDSDWYIRDNKRLMGFYFHCILVGLKVARGQEEQNLLRKQVNRLIGLSPSIGKGRSVLHLAVTCYWTRSILGDHVPDLPYDLLVSFLLQGGADVHARDDNRNTPLHLIALGFSEKEGDLELLCGITHALLKAGAFVGVQNSQGKTPRDVARTEAVAALLQQHLPATLKSLAATAVVEHQILCAGEIPKELEEFVQQHGHICNI